MSFRGSVRKRVIVWVLIAASLIISFYFDKEIVKALSSIRSSILNEFFLGLTFLSSEIVILFVLTTLFVLHYNKGKRRWILPLWITLALSGIVSFIMKYSIHRLRPFQQGIVDVLPVLEKASHYVWNFSFPSFHAMLVFSALPVLSKEFPKLKYAWAVFAVLVAFSRVYFGLHFMSDIIVGGVIGYAIGYLVVTSEQRTRFGEKFYSGVRWIFQRH